MRSQDSHLSDQQILLELEGELSAHAARHVRGHLAECWNCRARRQDLESAIGSFVRVHQRELDAKLPPAAGPRALLKARLAAEPDRRAGWLTIRRGSAWTAAAAVTALALFLVYLAVRRHTPPASDIAVVSIPDSRLTPGAALLTSRRAVCSQANPNNKAVPVALQRKVFEEYGLSGADPRAYEVDYLVTPALGGADDIHNLWPHSYSSTAWNARVKDALESRLREMVCDGELDLQEAQQEIATNWIAAYKKVFHTETPLPQHRDQSFQ